MEWIKCSDRMPEAFQPVLFYSAWAAPRENIAAGRWNGRGWVPVGDAEGNSPGVEWWSKDEVTHWMPRPEPPTE